MSWEQYWDGDPWIVRAYRQKHMLAIEARNQEAWWQGQYFLMAIGSVLSKDVKYPSEPVRITPMTEIEEQYAIAKARQKTIDYLTQKEKRWKAAHTELEYTTPLLEESIPLEGGEEEVTPLDRDEKGIIPLDSGEEESSPLDKGEHNANTD